MEPTRREFMLCSAGIVVSSATIYCPMWDRYPARFINFGTCLWGWESGDGKTGRHKIPLQVFNRLINYTTEIDKPGFRLYPSVTKALSTLHLVSASK